MAQLRGHVREPGKTNQFHPLEATKQADGTFILQVDTIAGATPHHYNGDAEVAPVDVDFDNVTKTIIIENLHATNSILVSFDGDSNVYTIRPDKVLSLSAAVISLRISASGATTPYQILTTE